MQFCIWGVLNSRTSYVLLFTVRVERTLYIYIYAILLQHIGQGIPDSLRVYIICRFCGTGRDMPQKRPPVIVRVSGGVRAAVKLAAALATAVVP